MKYAALFWLGLALLVGGTILGSGSFGYGADIRAWSVVSMLAGAFAIATYHFHT